MAKRQKAKCVTEWQIFKMECFSEWCTTRIGSIGPLLFLIFINDIDDDAVSKLCKFADDTKIGRAVGSG